MVEVEVDVTVGGSMPLTVPSTTTSIDLLQGAGCIAGWSLRDSIADVPADATGSVIAPAAGATIASITGVAAGEYTIHWTVELQGAAAAADANNFQLLVNAAVVTNSVNLGAAGDYPQPDAVVNAPAGATVTVKAIGAGTAGVTYTADVSIVPNGLIESIGELTSGNDVLGEISVSDQAVDTRWFGPAGPRFNQKLTLTVTSGALKGSVYVVAY